MSYVSPSRLLRAALVIDAACSGALAAVQILAPYAMARWLGLPVEMLVGSSVVLAALAALMIWPAPGVAVARALVGLVVCANLGWCVGCAVLTAIAQAEATALGIGYLLLQAVASVAFAGAQALGLKRSAPAPRVSLHLAWKEIL